MLSNTQLTASCEIGCLLYHRRKPCLATQWNRCATRHVQLAPDTFVSSSCLVLDSTSAFLVDVKGFKLSTASDMVCFSPSTEPLIFSTIIFLSFVFQCVNQRMRPRNPSLISLRPSSSCWLCPWCHWDPSRSRPSPASDQATRKDTLQSV